MNNISILTKCVEELKKEKPRYDYINGLLEALIEMQTESPKLYAIQAGREDAVIKAIIEERPKDEAAILDAKAKAALASVKALSEASAHE